jgi:hypothetical protein
VHYLFVDPALDAQSSGQKLMVRIDPRSPPHPRR